MSDLKIPRSLAEEKAEHGLFWRINTVIGFTAYDAVCCFIFLPSLLYSEGLSAEVIMKGCPAYFAILFGFWLIMLLPGIFLRAAVGKRGSVLLSCLASLIGMLTLSALSVAVGQRFIGPLLLFIFLAAPYKVVRSHFGLRALGIPLPLPEWKEPALVPIAANKGRRAPFVFSPIFRVLYAIFAIGGIGTGIACYFESTRYNYEYGCLFTALVLLPAYHLGRFCMDAFGKAVDAYRQEKPERTLSYTAIVIITLATWSGLVCGIATPFLSHRGWGNHLALDYTFTLFCVLAALALLALFRYLCKRFVRVETASVGSPEPSPATDEFYRPAPRVTRVQVHSVLALLLILLLGWLGFILHRDVRRFPQKYSDTTLKYLARDAYHERMLERSQPDVDVLPAYRSSPAEYEMRAAKHIAAIYLQEEGSKYRKLLEPNDSKKRQAVMLYTTFFGESANIYTVCRYVISELPQEEQQELKEQLCKLSPASWSGTEDKEKVLDQALRKLAYHRFHHPEAKRHGGVRPCSDRELEQQTKALITAIRTHDTHALRHAIAAGGDIETEVFLHSDMTFSYDTRKQQDKLIPLLHYALQEGFVEGVDSLLKHGASLRHNTTSSADCRQAVSRAKDKEKQQELIRLLHSYGLQANASSIIHHDSDLQEQ